MFPLPVVAVGPEDRRQALSLTTSQGRPEDRVRSRGTPHRAFSLVRHRLGAHPGGSPRASVGGAPPTPGPAPAASTAPHPGRSAPRASPAHLAPRAAAAVSGCAWPQTPPALLSGSTRGADGPGGRRSPPPGPHRGPRGGAGAVCGWPWCACEGAAGLHAPGAGRAPDRDAGAPGRVVPGARPRGWAAAPRRGATRRSAGGWTARARPARRPGGEAWDLWAPQARLRPGGLAQAQEPGGGAPRDGAGVCGPRPA